MPTDAADPYSGDPDHKPDPFHPPPSDTLCGPWYLPEVDPKPRDAPCDCCNPAPPKQHDPCPKPPRTKGKDQDCCQQILDILRQMPGGSDIVVKKPKQSVKVKTANLCCSLPEKDAAIPILLLLLRRFLTQTPPANDFEKGMQAFLAGLSPDTLDLLKLGQTAYDKMPPSVRECAFETRFLTCDNEALLDPQFILNVLLNEAIRLGRATLFDWSNGDLRTGGMRLWDRTIPADITDGHVITPETVISGPWPWICQVNPGADNRNWYKNRDVTRPGNRPLNFQGNPDGFIFEKHEFSMECSDRSDPNVPGNIRLECLNRKPAVPPPPAPGDFPTFGGNHCETDPRYDFPDPNLGTICLEIPKTYPGQGIALRGLNFLSPNCKVRLRRMGGGFQDLVLSCGVMGDTETPLIRDGKVVASCEVRDIITFTLPDKVKVGVNDIPVPPGRYILDVIVPNDSHYAPTPGTPPTEFVSNDVWLDVLPNPDQAYRVFTDEAFCIEETDGLGSDEPWFQAYIAQFNPASVGTGLLVPPGQTQVTIMRTSDVDSGESITFTPVDLFKGKVELGGAVAIAVYGLEVDSETAADKQIRDFADAYALYWSNAITLSATGADVSFLTGLIVNGTATALTVAAGIVGLIAIVITSFFYAGWAPADPIGVGFLVFDGFTLFDRTNPRSPLPASTSQSFGDLSLSVTPRIKPAPQAGGTHVIYSEEHVYRSEDEDSSYKLVYRVERV